MQKASTTGPLLKTAVLLLALVAGGLLFYRMVGYLETMTLLMGRMADSVAAMHGEMEALRVSVQNMEQHMAELDRTVGQGTREMQRLNPLQMMAPGGK
jgi:predicted LPLAT superfamily acyltransferase